MGNYPSGTVTFLFTDIEGSTKLAQGHPDKWESLRERHHAILQSAMEAQNGYVFQIIGDAFCAAFHTAGDALRATVKSQTDLHNEDWGDTPIRVRMAIHTGNAQAVNDNDQSGGYKGYTSMARVQRLMSAAHGGQVLISAAAQELLLEDLPENISLRDLGERRLKDLIRPERIYQAVTPDLPTEFPPLKTLDAYRHNLPIQLTSFIGREKEMEQIAQTIRAHRLVTLTGVGGTGKTRLALQVAAELLDQFSDGVWFVELVSVSDPELIPRTILAAFGIHEQPGRTILQILMDYFRERTLLLVLDNCEHLIEPSAKLADILLHQSHSLKILATSREALGVAGEATWHVPSLSLPDVNHPPTLERLTQYEAVRLFIDRAILVQPTFAVTNDNASFVAQICSRLDGIPLAIELAAARIRALSVDQINKRLDDRFRLLTGGSRTSLERHQTLRATIDWSYNLLTEEEKKLFRSLAVFSGGWTLEAAESVCRIPLSLEGRGARGQDILDLLTQLVDKSLVIAQDSRYRMLETTRQYALEKLLDFNESEWSHNKHAEYFLDLAEKAESHLIGPAQAQWLNHLEREHDNFRTALEWSMQAGRGEEALRMADALGMFWFKHSHFSEGRRWLGNILKSTSGASEQAQVKAARSAGLLARWQKDTVEARRIFTQNLEREQALGDQWGIAFTLHMFGNIVEIEGDLEQAKELNKKSIALSREIGAIWVLAMAQTGLAYVEQTQGNLAIAEQLYEESLTHCRHIGEKWGMELNLTNLGYLIYSRGDILTAKKVFLECLDIAKELGSRDDMTIILAGLASIMQNEGRHIASARLQGVVVARGRELGTSLYPVEQGIFDSTAKALKESMGEQAYQKEFETGMTLALDEAVNLVFERT